MRFTATTRASHCDGFGGRGLAPCRNVP